MAREIKVFAFRQPNMKRFVPDSPKLWENINIERTPYQFYLYFLFKFIEKNFVAVICPYIHHDELYKIENVKIYDTNKKLLVDIVWAEGYYALPSEKKEIRISQDNPFGKKDLQLLLEQINKFYDEHLKGDRLVYSVDISRDIKIIKDNIPLLKIKKF